MSKRVFQLAKELGVTSKVILEKCRAESIGMKNHMATISVGLEVTVREWFSEGANVTAVETSEAVDIEAAKAEGTRQRRKRHVSKEPQEQTETDAVAEGAEEQSVVAEEEPEVQVEAEPKSPAEVLAEQADASAEVPGEVEPAPGEGPRAEQVPTEEFVEATERELPDEPTAAAEAARVVPNEPEPLDVTPAGPQVVPKPAQLQGPQVVRVERPDMLPTPRPRPQTSRYSSDGNGNGNGNASGGASTERRGRGPVGEGSGASKVGASKTGAQKTKRRSPRRKGGRTGGSGEGIREWRDRDLDERRERLAAASTGGLRRHRATVRRGGDGSYERSGPVEVEEPINVKTLSAAMGVKTNELIKRLMGLGIMATVNQPISIETANMLASGYGLELKIKRQLTAWELLEEKIAQREPQQLEPRPPVVTFLGHVDHGKTSLLDRIRSATVVTTESGGITQHIGSYRHEKAGRVVTFLDTPGHEAFTQMRARGANMTDVVVLVVAADDGVMPQTIEAINHAKAAGVPIVVALNKIDLPNANATRVLGQLSEYDLQPREWGGKTEVVKTSATTGEGIDELVEVLSLEAELLELKADATAPARGTVIEAEMDPGRGAVARVLIQDGTLRVGDVVLAGPGYGRVRQIVNDRGEMVDYAGPATPVEVSGLNETPTAGDAFYAIEDIGGAKEIAEDHRQQRRKEQLVVTRKISLDNLFQQIASGNVSELPLIVKADVQGSVEVLVDSLNKLSTDEVRVKILHAAVGGVSSGDVLLAEASNAIILGFHVVPDNATRQLAEELGVDIRLYRVIYQLTDEVKLAMEGLLAPEIKEEVLGHAEVRETFRITRVGTVAGCYVTDGVIRRNAKLRIIRDSIVIEDERVLDSLKRFKDDSREVRNGMECGVKIVGYDDVKNGDILEAYVTVEIARKL